MGNNIKSLKGNIFSSNCQTLVNTVNCVGVMGAGIALEFKYRYPAMFEKYVKYCNDNLIQIGKLWVYDIPGTAKKVLNFPTKRDWKNPSKYDYLEKGLIKFIETYKEKGISSVAFPLLGAQNGGLEPDKVLRLMIKYLSLVDIRVEIYEFDPNSKDDLIDNFRDFILNSSQNEVISQTGLSISVLKIIHHELMKSKAQSLIQLLKVKGIGEESIKLCFQYAMKIKHYPHQVTPDLFSAITSTLDSSVSTLNPSKTKKKKAVKILDENQVALIESGLSKTKIKAILNSSDTVSIGDLIIYCKILNIDFITFISDKYINNLNDGK